MLEQTYVAKGYVLFSSPNLGFRASLWEAQVDSPHELGHKTARTSRFLTGEALVEGHDMEFASRPRLAQVSTDVTTTARKEEDKQVLFSWGVKGVPGSIPAAA